ncbi:MAG: T9SS type A sorting domain-containing protein, partial [Candidatus Poribacteria bacterium]|nr:T9SS type A sorting domain-containing protein [Candidatus Poribacteria bacterium]
ATEKLIDRFEGYARHPRMIGFSSDGSRFITLDRTVRVWNTATTEIIAEIQYDNESSAAAISPNGKYVAITHSDRRITVWDVDTATVKHVLAGALWGGIMNWTVTFSPDSHLVAAVTYSPIIRVWKVETGELIAELDHWGDDFSFAFVRFSPDGKWLVGGGINIAIWDTREFTLQHTIMTTRRIRLGTAVFSPDSRWFGMYTGTRPDNMQLFNIETGELEFELQTGVAATAEFSPDGRWLAAWQWGTTEENGNTRYEPVMRFWDVENRRVVLNLPKPLYSHAMFSPDGRFIALNHKDHRIHLQSVETILPHYIVQRLRISTWGKIKKNALFQNYPNPFNLETWIPYRLTVPSLGRINIYDVTGHNVRTLQIGMRQEGDYVNQDYAAYWDGRDEIGEPVAAGLYFYQLETDAFSATRRMVILK